MNVWTCSSWPWAFWSAGQKEASWGWGGWGQPVSSDWLPCRTDCSNVPAVNQLLLPAVFTILVSLLLLLTLRLPQLDCQIEHEDTLHQAAENRTSLWTMALTRRSSERAQMQIRKIGGVPMVCAGPPDTACRRRAGRGGGGRVRGGGSRGVARDGSGGGATELLAEKTGQQVGVWERMNEPETVHYTSCERHSE